MSWMTWRARSAGPYQEVPLVVDFADQSVVLDPAEAVQERARL